MQVKVCLTLLALTASTILQAQNIQSAPGAEHHRHQAEAVKAGQRDTDRICLSAPTQISLIGWP
jgi:hypothetical protein